MIKQLVMNLILALIWVSLTGKFSFVNLTFGFVLGFLVLWLMARNSGGNPKYFNRVPRIIGFAFVFLYELAKANLQVTYEVMTPTNRMKPGIVKIPLEAKTNLEITLLSNLISLTPGTLILDVSDDRKVMYVHSMHIQDRDLFVNHIKMSFEKRLLAILR